MQDLVVGHCGGNVNTTAFKVLVGGGRHLFKGGIYWREVFLLFAHVEIICVLCIACTVTES